VTYETTGRGGAAVLERLLVKSRKIVKKQFFIDIGLNLDRFSSMGMECRQDPAWLRFSFTFLMV
jgi:hypothetical protein